MAKITIASILSGFRSVSAFNTVLQLIGTNLNDKVLYRDNPAGEDNVMKNSLDMNSNTILNLPVPVTGTEPVRFDQLTAFIAGGAIPIQEEGTDIVGIPTKLNFVGSNVTVTDVAGVANITLVDVDTFTNLTDTPASFSGQANKSVTVNSGETALEFTSTAPSAFTGLTDTPSAYTGKAGQTVVVNSGENALEFTVGSPVLHVREEQPSAIEGGTNVAGLQVRTLNTVLLNTIVGASLASNQITLPAGTYDIHATAPSFGTARHRIQWLNVTDTVITLLGLSSFTFTTDSVTTQADLIGRFTINATKVFELKHFMEGIKTTFGLGAAVSDGNTEVYAEVFITKV